MHLHVNFHMQKLRVYNLSALYTSNNRFIHDHFYFTAISTPKNPAIPQIYTIYISFIHKTGVFSDKNKIIFVEF